MSVSTQVEKPISNRQKEHLELFKKAQDSGEEYIEVDDNPDINLLTIRALEQRKLVERESQGGADWPRYRITEKGLRAIDDPESVISLTPDMDKALRLIFDHDQRMRAECGLETWVYPWAINVHENTMRALLKRGFVEEQGPTERSTSPTYRITEKGREYVKRLIRA